MGLFNLTCLLSGLSIYDEPCLVVFLQSGLYGGAVPGGGLAYPGDCWRPLSPFLSGAYDGYGGIQVDPADPVVRWAQGGIAQALREPAVDLNELQARVLDSEPARPVSIPAGDPDDVQKDVLGIAHVRASVLKALRDSALPGGTPWVTWHAATHRRWADSLSLRTLPPAPVSGEEVDNLLWEAFSGMGARPLPRWIGASLSNLAASGRSEQEVAPLLAATTDLIYVSDIMRLTRRAWMPQITGGQDPNAAVMRAFYKTLGKISK